MIDTIQIFLNGVPEFGVLAQATELGPQIKEIIKLLRMIALILAIASLIVSAIMFGTGRVEAAVYGVAAAGILALSASIVKFAFEATGDDFDL